MHISNWIIWNIIKLNDAHLFQDCFSGHPLTQPVSQVWNIMFTIFVITTGTVTESISTWWPLWQSTQPRVQAESPPPVADLLQTLTCWSDPCHCGWRSWRRWLWPRWRWLQCWCWWWPPSTDVILGPESNLIVARPTSPPELLLLLKPDNVLIIITIMMKIVTMSMTMMRMMGSIMTIRPDRVWGENHAKTLTGVRVHQL